MRVGSYFDLSMRGYTIGKDATNIELLINMMRYSYHWRDGNEYIKLFDWSINRIINQNKHNNVNVGPPKLLSGLTLEYFIQEVTD